MTKKEELLQKKKELKKKLSFLHTQINKLESEIAELENEIEELDNDWKYKDNIIKDLVSIFRYTWEDDKTKKKVTNSYISNKLLEESELCGDYKLRIYNRDSSFIAIYYDPEFDDIFKGIFFCVCENGENYNIYLGLAANDAVDSDTKQAVSKFQVFDEIKYISNEYSLLGDDYLASRVLVMTRYSTKYKYTDERIIKDFNIFYKYALHQSKINIQRRYIELDPFCKVLPNISEFNCGHPQRQISIKIPFLKPNGEIIQGGPYLAYYCKTCDIYYIESDIFENLKYSTVGIPLIQHDDKKISNGSGDLQAESILHICGYNVSREYDYTDQQRQRILAIIIDKKLLKKEKIINYLKFYLFISKNVPNKRTAVSKWTKDLLFVETYKRNN